MRDYPASAINKRSAIQHRPEMVVEIARVRHSPVSLSADTDLASTVIIVRGVIARIEFSRALANYLVKRIRDNNRLSAAAFSDNDVQSRKLFVALFLSSIMEESYVRLTNNG